MENQKHISMPVRYGINTTLIVLFLIMGYVLTSSGFTNRAQTSLILQIGIYIILAVSLNVATGYLGQLPLGHAGFMAVGAYSCGIFWKSSLASSSEVVTTLSILTAVNLHLFVGVFDFLKQQQIIWSQV